MLLTVAQALVTEFQRITGYDLLPIQEICWEPFPLLEVEHPDHVSVLEHGYFHFSGCAQRLVRVGTRELAAA